MPRKAWGAVQVVSKLPKNVGEVILRMTAIVKGMREHPELFPSPIIALDVVDAHIEALRKAQTALRMGTKGTKEPRNAALRLIRQDAIQLESYVNILAGFDRTKAAVYAGAAAMFLRKFGGRVVPDITIKQLRRGAVSVVARAMRGAKAYEWDLSIQGGVTHARLDGTVRARCIIENLAPGSFIQVRVRGITAAGVTDWVTSRPFAVS